MHVYAYIYIFFFFREAFPTITVEDITLAHDIRHLSKLDEERDCVEQARLYCESYAKKRGPLQMYPYPCGQVIGYCCKKVNISRNRFINDIKTNKGNIEPRKLFINNTSYKNMIKIF